MRLAGASSPSPRPRRDRRRETNTSCCLARSGARSSNRHRSGWSLYLKTRIAVRAPTSTGTRSQAPAHDSDRIRLGAGRGETSFCSPRANPGPRILRRRRHSATCGHRGASGGLRALGSGASWTTCCHSCLIRLSMSAAPAGSSSGIGNVELELRWRGRDAPRVGYRFALSGDSRGIVSDRGASPRCGPLDGNLRRAYGNVRTRIRNVLCLPAAVAVPRQAEPRRSTRRRSAWCISTPEKGVLMSSSTAPRLQLAPTAVGKSKMPGSIERRWEGRWQICGLPASPHLFPQDVPHGTFFRPPPRLPPLPLPSAAISRLRGPSAGALDSRWSRAGKVRRPPSGREMPGNFAARRVERFTVADNQPRNWPCTGAIESRS